MLKPFFGFYHNPFKASKISLLNLFILFIFILFFHLFYFLPNSLFGKGGPDRQEDLCCLFFFIFFLSDNNKIRNLVWMNVNDKSFSFSPWLFFLFYFLILFFNFIFFNFPCFLLLALTFFFLPSRQGLFPIAKFGTKVAQELVDSSRPTH
ncbi:hypothetical protein, no similarity [Geotrichum candidum]|uniref:Uncharacterized protein n=1 Tax=Geotrichum candidum TaxID=1173061 RepID=A0A0J9XE77_GEOCN|nr:hypothetical protein, no similarity [Geotrichum candidum]